MILIDEKELDAMRAELARVKAQVVSIDASWREIQRDVIPRAKVRELMARAVRWARGNRETPEDHIVEALIKAEAEKEREG